MSTATTLLRLLRLGAGSSGRSLRIVPVTDQRLALSGSGRGSRRSWSSGSRRRRRGWSHLLKITTYTKWIMKIFMDFAGQRIAAKKFVTNFKFPVHSRLYVRCGRKLKHDFFLSRIVQNIEMVPNQCTYKAAKHKRFCMKMRWLAVLTRSQSLGQNRGTVDLEIFA